MNAKVPFDREAFGYNRTQVDSYVNLLIEAYREVFREYEKAVARNVRRKIVVKGEGYGFQEPAGD